MQHVIIRYKNRKLYSHKVSDYVTLEDIKKMLSEGDNIKVVDKPSQSDITNSTVMKTHVKFGLPKEILVEYI